jgi:hypothetical protein
LRRRRAAILVGEDRSRSRLRAGSAAHKHYLVTNADLAGFDDETVEREFALEASGDGWARVLQIP